MKHAVLIIAHCNRAYVESLAGSFDEDFRLFLHWDRKHPLAAGERASLAAAGRGGMHVGQEYSADWGSYGIVAATLYLCREALKDPSLRYFHLISGADALTAGLDTFKRFFLLNEGKNFMDYGTLPRESWAYGGWDRVRNCPSLPDGFRWYGGSAWWSLTRECVAFLVEQEENIRNVFAKARIPDELFAQTVLMNSPYARTVVNDNLRYVSWGWRNGNNPAVLDHTDLLGIADGHKFFARKIDPAVSKTLLQGIACLRRAERPVQDPVENLGLDEVARRVGERITPDLSGGLYLGNIGAALFLQFYGQAAGRDLRERRDAALRYSEEELRTTDDPTYETGRLGIAAGLECLLDDATVRYGEETLVWLNEINRRLLHYLLNSAADDLPESFCRSCAAYFFARERGNRLTGKDRSLREYLRQRFPLRTEVIRPKQMEWNHTAGLAGYAGYGLRCLVEEGRIRQTVYGTFVHIEGKQTDERRCGP